MKIAVIVTLVIMIMGSVSIQGVSGHQPSFVPTDAAGILKFCEFFYDEYKILGEDSLANQHPNYPSLRQCVILYKHVAWLSTHELRDVVLIKEIEKYLGDSDHLKERHLTEFTKMPDWIRNDVKLWAKGESKDSTFAYGIRAMLENNILTTPIIDNIGNRICNDNGLCMKETDYVTYSHTSKFQNTTTEKFEIKKIDSNGILISLKKISEDKIENIEFYLDENRKIPMEQKCCKTTKFLYKTPIEMGQIIEDGYQIIGTTGFPIGEVVRTGLVAQNPEKTILLVIDKETGFLLSEKFEKTLITTDWEKSSLIKTNVFQDSVGIQLHGLHIPKWLKTTTMWYTEGITSETEYLDAVEYLISKQILVV